MAASLGSLDSLSTDAIAAERGGADSERLRQQAANNVSRQVFASQIRGDPPKKPAGPSSSGAKKGASDPIEKKEDEIKAAKELADLIQKVESFMRHPTLGEKLRGIAVPRSGTKLEYLACLEQIRNKLGEGLGEQTMKWAYFQGVQVGCAFLQMPNVPEKLRMPPNADQYMGNALFNPDASNRRFDNEFAELAIEYSKFFRSGPLSRLIFGTIRTLIEYKDLVEKGVIDPRTGQISFGGVPASEEPQGPIPPPDMPAHFPPPTHIYPEPVKSEPYVPAPSIPTISSRDSIFDIIEPIPATSISPAPKKKSTRGKGI